jgi:hypothetical protein
MFDLGGLPSDAVIEETTLRLSAITGGLAVPPVSVSAHYCPSNDWTEYEITYNNKPEFEAQPLDTVNNITSGTTWAFTWYEWHVTNTVQTVFNRADKRISFTMKTDDDSGMSFNSRNSPSVDNRPQLSVLYSYTPSSGVDPILVGTIVIGVAAASAIGLVAYTRRKRRKTSHMITGKETMLRSSL